MSQSKKPLPDGLPDAMPLKDLIAYVDPAPIGELVARFGFKLGCQLKMLAANPALFDIPKV